MANPNGRKENLRPWRKGQSGNPGGRPKSAPVSAAFRAILNQDAKEPILGPNPTKAELLAAQIYQAAVKHASRGDMRAALLVIERAEGRSPERAAEESERPRIEIPATDDRWPDDGDREDGPEEAEELGAG